MATSMRLRLVVRRNGMPDARVLFIVALDEDPTVSKLLELVNATIPLESNDWGLEDYVVELRAPDGSAFEALHFQTVASVLKQDEEVHIRPLLTNDLKKRRISGRHQISGDGRHLIDGVPFGRPLLRQPRDRPAIDIPPRKRRRLLAHDPESPDDSDDSDASGDADRDSQPLQLTQHGEPPSYLEDEDEEDGDFSDDADEDDIDLDDEGDGIDKEELNALRHDYEDAGYDFPVSLSEISPYASSDDMSLDDGDDDIDKDELTALRLDNEAAGYKFPVALSDMPSHPSSDDQGSPAQVAARDMDSDSEGAIADLKASMAAAFPDASDATLVRAFRKCHDRNGSYIARKIFKWLKKRHVPHISYKRVKRHYRSRARDPAADGDVGGLQDSERPVSAQSNESVTESVGSLVRYYDQHGFPSGSIGDGTALGHMADAIRRRPKQLSSPTPDDGADQGDGSGSDNAESDEERASEMECSDSESEHEAEHESDSASEPEHVQDAHSPSESTDSQSGSPMATRRSPRAGSNASSESESEDEAESDGEEAYASDADDDGELEAAAQTELPTSDQVESDDDSSEGGSAASSDSEEDSDGDGDDQVVAEQPAKTAPNMASDDTSSEEESSSEDDSGDSSSEDEEASSSEGEDGSSSDDSDSDSSDDEQPEEMSAKAPSSSSASAGAGAGASSTPRSQQASQAPANGETAQGQDEGHAPAGSPGKGSSTVPPGQGCKRTHNRNARRRARQALLRNQRMLEERNLLEERKNALLAAIGCGPETPAAPPGVAGGGESMLAEPGPAAATTSDSESTTANSQKRRSQVDIEPGRRMIFASLGRRVPGSKEEADKIRADLMKDVKPHVNHRLAETGVANSAGEDGDEGEDPDAWKEKIDYQAVECAEQDVQLSEPPFPFVQRWDPAQRSQSRGGRRKRKQTMQSDHYEQEQQEEDHDRSSRPGKKLKFADQPDKEVAELNYDDVVDSGDKDVDAANGASVADSQLTDWDDLPSLPKDLTTLPVLRFSDVKPLMVITWKKWLLSQATDWQPQVVDVTAVVKKVNEEDQTLDVIMAVRDRHLDAIDKVFDEETGERVYSAFDLPEFSDDEEDPAEVEARQAGWRTVAFVDMIEPRIRQPPLTSEDEPMTLDSQVLSPASNLGTVGHATGSVIVPDSQAPPNMEDAAAASKSVTSGGKLPMTGVKTTDSCVPETDQDHATGSTNSRAHQAAQLPSDADVLMFDDDAPNALNASANTPAPLADSLVPYPPLASATSAPDAMSGAAATGQPLLRPPQSADKSDDSPSREVVDDALPVLPGRLASQQVGYPSLSFPTSDAGSFRSGRQPDADDNADMDQDAFSNPAGTDDDGQDEDRAATPRASKSSRQDAEPQTPAKSDKNTSPSRTAPQVVASAKDAQAARRDAEYREAMRRLDDSEDEEAGADRGTPTAEQKQKSVQIKQSSSQQPLASVERDQPSQRFKKEKIKAEPQSFATAVSPPSHSARGAIRGTTFGRGKENRTTGPSRPPPNADVILLSSSPEPVYEEDYAGDDVDGDYESSSHSLKTRKAASREPRASPRGASMPARAKSAASVLGGPSRAARSIS